MEIYNIVNMLGGCDLCGGGFFVFFFVFVGFVVVFLWGFFFVLVLGGGCLWGGWLGCVDLYNFCFNELNR